MAELAQRLEQAREFLRARGIGEPKVALVLGSGLSDAIALENSVSVPYAEIPGFPSSPGGAVAGHAGRLEAGNLAGVPVLVLHGRVHYYEGVELSEATFPVRVAKSLGARWIGLTNASGGIDPAYEVGDLVLITDHLNLLGDNPLIGPNDDSIGPRFPDMSKAYDPELRRRAERVARETGLSLKHGVYAAVAGPTYETPTELRLLRLAGADLVGMSTVPETIVAVHGGLKVLGLSVVTDLAFPEAAESVSHEAVVKAARAAAGKVAALLTGVIREEA
ncbi:MAG: purine-nucleoside phosphorylase [bacterium]